MLKYNPKDIIQSIGFNGQVKDVLNNELTDDLLEEFTEKFFRNNPEQAIFVKIEKKHKGQYEDRTDNATFNIDPESKKYDGDVIAIKQNGKSDGDDRSIYTVFIRTNDDDYNPVLYKLNKTLSTGLELRYDKVRLLGSAGSS